MSSQAVVEVDAQQGGGCRAVEVLTETVIAGAVDEVAQHASDPTNVPHR